MSFPIPISGTGIRSGEYITNRQGSKQNVGTIIQVKGEYPPTAGVLTELEIRDTLTQIPFFSEMSYEERKKWLRENSTTARDLYLEDVRPELLLRFVKIGGTFFINSLSEETISMLLQPNPNREDGYWPVTEVYNLFPRKPGSRARKHTLIFRPSNWALYIDRGEEYEGEYYDLTTNEVKEGRISSYILLEEIGYPIAYKQERKAPPEWKDVVPIITALLPTDEKEIQQVREELAWFSPSIHKSLIQKIIRTRCRRVRLPKAGEKSGCLVLLVSLGMLLVHPGSFVPNIQRFVTGLESTAKRLAVSICEDSYYSGSLTPLFAAALVAQRDRAWFPTDSQIRAWFTIALAAQRESRCFDHDWKSFREEELPESEWGLNYYILKEVKSFHSDIAMVGSIAVNGGRYRKPSFNTTLFPVMGVEHCLDQHCLPEIAYYLPYRPGVSYTVRFQEIWDKASGVNPRLLKYQEWRPDPEIVKAQQDLWYCKTVTPTHIPTPSGEEELEYVLDPSWLAGMVGPIEVRVGRSTAIVVLRSDNLQTLIAVKRPSRDTKDPQLTPEEERQAISSAEAILRRGVEITPPLDVYEGMVCIRDSEGEYYLQDGDTQVSWENARRVTTILNTYNYSLEGDTLRDAANLDADGIHVQADMHLQNYLESSSYEVLSRLLSYLERSQTRVELYSISSDGTGTEYTVLPEDTAVFQSLARFCLLYPGALKMVKGEFIVGNPALLWHIRDRVREYLRSTTVTEGKEWILSSIEERKLWPHQEDILQEMLNRYERGRMKHVLWAPVGTGKSLIVCEYVKAVIRAGGMLPYCLWILPPAAVDSVVREIRAAGFKVNILDARRTKNRNVSILPGVINIAWYDHLRLMERELREVAPSLFLIADEFHLAMSATKRTSVTLELARLSPAMIALSGTIIKDQHVGELIEWLSQVVEFDVTKENYWVAVASLVSRKIEVPVPLRREEIDAWETEDPLTDPKEMNYYSLVPPSLGGTSNSLDFRAAIAKCYEASVLEMVRQALNYIEAGEIVFLVATNSKQQERLNNLLQEAGVERIHLITPDSPLTLTPEMKTDLQAVITTAQQSTGYSLSKIAIGIQPVIFSNQNLRTQILGRIHRFNSPREVTWITVHCGILSYIWRRYERARTLSEALQGFAKDMGVEYTRDTLTEIRRAFSEAE